MTKKTTNAASKSWTVQSMDWFDDHVIVMGPNADFEDKMREALKKKVCQEYQKRPGRKGAKK
jgi:hypothetical protein